MSKMSTTHKLSHYKIDNKIYYSDLSYKLIIKKRKIIIIQYIISYYLSSVSSTLSSSLSVSHLIIFYIIITDYSLIYISSVSASVFFFLLDESKFFSNFHSLNFSYYFINIII